jgi:hypothetical protein
LHNNSKHIRHINYHYLYVLYILISWFLTVVGRFLMEFFLSHIISLKVLWCNTSSLNCPTVFSNYDRIIIVGFNWLHNHFKHDRLISCHYIYVLHIFISWSLKIVGRFLTELCFSQVISIKIPFLVMQYIFFKLSDRP